MTTPARAELIERLKANPRFVEAKPGAAVVIVGAQGQPLTPANGPSQPSAGSEARKP